MILEIACFTIQSAILAAAAGADRIELCDNAAEGGTTPSYGSLQAAKELISIPVFPIVRPRGGDFFYTNEEYKAMMYDVEMCKQLHCKGIVTGILHKNGTVDIERTSHLVDVAYPMEVTFHRAFDRSKDPFVAMEDVIQCGCKRILTSGQVPNAFDGKQLIFELVQQADNRIIIMPGSGVRSHNIAELIQFTNVNEIHSSARKTEASGMMFTKESMQEIIENITVDTYEIQKMKEAMIK